MVLDSTRDNLPNIPAQDIIGSPIQQRKRDRCIGARAGTE